MLVITGWDLSRLLDEIDEEAPKAIQVHSDSELLLLKQDQEKPPIIESVSTLGPHDAGNRESHHKEVEDEA